MKPRSSAGKARQTSPSAISAPWITIAARSRTFTVDKPRIRTLAATICASLGVGEQELSLNFVGARSMRRLNREFRQIDKSTDVLAFPQQEWAEALRVSAKKRAAVRPAPAGPAAVLGDVIISLPDAAANAQRIGQPLDREVGFLLVHGILHLCGHDHHEDSEERRMRLAQRSLMRLLATGREPLWRRCVRSSPPLGRP